MALTQTELCAGLSNLGLPVAYGEFLGTEENPAPSPPFITYQFSRSNDLIADNQNYVDISSFQIELYISKKDLASEKLIQDWLKAQSLPYTKFETWIDTEKMWQVVYEIQLIGG